MPLTDFRFTDNFDPGVSPSWTFWENPTKGMPHEHTVKNGELVLENSRAILGEPNWTNYVARARIYLESVPATGEGVAGFSVRRTRDNPSNPGSFSFYFFILTCSNGHPDAISLGILHHGSTGQTQIGTFEEQRHRLALKEWHNLELEVKGHRLRGYLDGQLVAEATDDRLSQGGLHLDSSSTCVRFDDFSVQLLP